MKVNKIYLDMDGVLCNFEKRYFDLFNETPGSSRDRKEFSQNWTDFIVGNNFEHLELFPGALELLSYVR